VPTANPAALARPRTTNGRRFGRLTALLLALPLAAVFATAEPPIVGAQAGPSCSSHASLTRPPDSIRVLRVRTGRVTVVNFRKYVVTVMGKEWPSYLPQPVVEAGAVAVKQYAWYHAVYSSRSANGRCFDVKDGTGDQLYKPGRARIRPDHYRALDATWGVTLRKDGRFFMTGYRRGDKVRCGRDATGWKLFARSATQCAYHGAGWREILRTYYGPSLVFAGDGGGAGQSTTSSQPSAQRAQTTAVRLSNGRWIDPSTTPEPTPDRAPAPPAPAPAPPAPVVAAPVGFAGGLGGGVAAILEEQSQLVL
jgi:Stage II sporulation protein